MKITEYLNQFLDDFKTNYTNYSKIQTSVGYTPELFNLRNQNDLPLILIEEINYLNDTNGIIQNIGTLNFDLLYLDQSTDENLYTYIENNFMSDFNNYLKNYCGDFNINNINFSMDEDNRYGVTYSLSVRFELS